MSNERNSAIIHVVSDRHLHLALLLFLLLVNMQEKYVIRYFLSSESYIDLFFCSVLLLSNIYHQDFYSSLVKIFLLFVIHESNAFLYAVSLGPYKLNGVSLRRVNQIYVIATSTKLDISAGKFDAMDDAFFKRVRSAKKNAEKDIFDTKKEVILTEYIF